PARASPPPTPATTASPTASSEWRPPSTRDARRWRSAPAPSARRSARANSPPLPLSPSGGVGIDTLSLQGGRGQGEGVGLLPAPAREGEPCTRLNRRGCTWPGRSPRGLLTSAQVAMWTVTLPPCFALE